jgi:hypothetical protein
METPTPVYLKQFARATVCVGLFIVFHWERGDNDPFLFRLSLIHSHGQFIEPFQCQFLGCLGVAFSLGGAHLGCAKMLWRNLCPHLTGQNNFYIYEQ